MAMDNEEWSFFLPNSNFNLYFHSGLNKSWAPGSHVAKHFHLVFSGIAMNFSIFMYASSKHSPVVGSYEHSNKPSGFRKDGEFDLLSDHWLLK
jgi:hypothetical protein